MEIQQLRHLLCAASESNYSQAAKACFTSRQNIAHSIKIVERQVGSTLFVREGNQMTLTPEGVEVVKIAREVVDKVDRLDSLFDSDVDTVPQLNLGISTNLFAGIPSNAASTFMNYRGGVRFSELSCEDCFNSVSSRKLDAALIMCMEQEFPGCDSLEIAGSPSYALASEESPLAQLSSLSPPDLVNEKLLLMSSPPFQYKRLFLELDQLGFDRNAVNIIPSTSSMLHLVRRRRSVGIVSSKFAALPPDGTVAIPFSSTSLNWRFYMLCQSESSSYSSIVRLAQIIRDCFLEDPECGTAK